MSKDVQSYDERKTPGFATWLDKDRAWGEKGERRLTSHASIVIDTDNLDAKQLKLLKKTGPEPAHLTLVGLVAVIITSGITSAVAAPLGMVAVIGLTIGATTLVLTPGLRKERRAGKVQALNKTTKIITELQYQLPQNVFSKWENTAEVLRSTWKNSHTSEYEPLDIADQAAKLRDEQAKITQAWAETCRTADENPRNNPNQLTRPVDPRVQIAYKDLLAVSNDINKRANLLHGQVLKSGQAILDETVNKEEIPATAAVAAITLNGEN